MIAIYDNIGTNRGQDTEDQLAKLQSCALKQHYKVRLFVDQESDEIGDRPEFRKLMEAAAHGEFEGVLVWALDRFMGDSVTDTFVNIQKLSTYGVPFVSYTERHFDTTDPAGEQMIAIATMTATWIAEQEHIRMSERIKVGLATARAKGKRLGRLRRVLPLGEMVVDRERGTSWRQIARKHHVPASTIREAFKKLEELGVPQP